MMLGAESLLHPYHGNGDIYTQYVRFFYRYIKVSAFRRVGALKGVKDVVIKTGQTDNLNH